MRPFILLCVAALALTTGCGSLIPKRLEFFQSKVKPFPELTASQKETQREAAALAAKRANDTLSAANKAGSPAEVISPASDTVDLTRSVSTSLGPPKSPYTGPATNLSTKLDGSTANLNNRVEDFAKREEKFVGHKVEGTGLFSISYFSYIGGILLLIFLAWTALKIYGMVNPAVGAGVGIVGRVSSSVLSRGMAEVAAGGESFKNYLHTSGFDAAIKEKVLDLFSRAHKENQSSDVQDVIQKLTKK